MNQCRTTWPDENPRTCGALAAARRAQSAPRAFTLIELILVMVVVSVVLGIAAPSLRGFFASQQTGDAAQCILALTKYAQTESAARGQICRLNIDTQQGEFWLTIQQAGAYVEMKNDLVRHFNLPEGATMSVRSTQSGPTPEHVDFRPDGRNDQVTIELQGRQGEVFQVTTASAVEPYHVVKPSEAP